jgi:Domain of unknown function (DUF4190)
VTDQPPSYPPPPPPPPGGYGYPPPPQEPGGYGYPPPASGYPQPSAGTNGLAIASLVCSLLGWLCGIGPILGLVFGFIALNQIKQSGQSGRGMAIAGIVIGALAVVAFIALFVLGVFTSANEKDKVPRTDSGMPAVVLFVDQQPVWPALAA